MKISVMLLTLSVLISVSSCGKANNSAPASVQPSDNTRLSQNIRESNFTPPSAWKQVKSCGVTFYLPSDFREKKTQGDDSCLGWFQNKNTSLNLDVLGYNLSENESRRREYADKQDFQLENLLIDGRKAEIITCYDADVSKTKRGLNYLAILFVPNMGNGRGNLTIWTYNRSTEEQSTSRKIFETVKFAD